MRARSSPVLQEIPVVLLVIALLVPVPAGAQLGRFLNFGAGVGIPSGASSEMMDAGWMLQTMGGVTLPGGIVNVRVGGTYGQNRVRAGSGMGGMDEMMNAQAPAPVEGGTAWSLSLMGGVMLTPWLIAGVVPYAIADAGVVRSSYEGTASSFAWQVGGGLLVNATAAGWFIESRYMQARKNGNRGAMVPIAAGVRFMW
jgi:hypothetical protein